MGLSRGFEAVRNGLDGAWHGSAGVSDGFDGFCYSFVFLGLAGFAWHFCYSGLFLAPGGSR